MDVTAIPDTSRWQNFLDSLVDSHEEDVRAATTRAARQQATPRRGPLLKDLKPGRSRISRESSQSFEQWADDMDAWLVRIGTIMVMLMKATHLRLDWDNIAFERALQTKNTTAETEETECDLLAPVREMTGARRGTW